MCVSLDLNLCYDSNSETSEGFNSDIVLSYAKHIPTLRIISMLISRPDDSFYIRWSIEEEDATDWWLVTRVGSSVDLVAVHPNEGQSMKRRYNEEIFVDGMT